MAYQDNYLFTCFCCGLPVVIFCIANFGVQLSGVFFDPWALLIVLFVGMVFTVLGAMLLEKLGGG